jgi:hypothetical protein
LVCFFVLWSSVSFMVFERERGISPIFDKSNVTFFFFFFF